MGNAGKVPPTLKPTVADGGVSLDGAGRVEEQVALPPETVFYRPAGSGVNRLPDGTGTVVLNFIVPPAKAITIVFDNANFNMFADQVARARLVPDTVVMPGA